MIGTSTTTQNRRIAKPLEGLGCYRSGWGRVIFRQATEGRIFRGLIMQTYFLSQGKPLQGWPDNDVF
jgi:hypothetical protein